MMPRYRLLIGACIAQALVACALRVMPLPVLRAVAGRLRPLARLLLRGSDERVIWAVEATGRRLRGVSTCLVRAIVIDTRLRSAERPLRLTIGVKRTPVGSLQSHAWVVDHRERVLVGGPVDHGFAPIVAWESATS